MGTADGRKNSSNRTEINFTFQCITRFELMAATGSPRSSLETKKAPITDDYQISHNVLGLGINGKVVEVKNKKEGHKYALKVLKDNAKARREIELHWRSSSCKHIVNIKDVYENTQKGTKCLLVVMECMEGGTVRTDPRKAIIQRTRGSGVDERYLHRR